MGEPFPPPRGKCRRCGHALERLPAASGKPLRWGCTSIFCETQVTKRGIEIGGVRVASKGKTS